MKLDAVCQVLLFIESGKGNLTILVKERIEKLEMTKEAKYELLRIRGNSKEREIYERRKESLLNKVSALKNAE